MGLKLGCFDHVGFGIMCLFFELFANGLDLEADCAERRVIEAPPSIEDERRLWHRVVHTLVVVSVGGGDRGWVNTVSCFLERSALNSMQCKAGCSGCVHVWEGERTFGTRPTR